MDPHQIALAREPFLPSAMRFASWKMLELSQYTKTSPIMYPQFSSVTNHDLQDRPAYGDPECGGQGPDHCGYRNATGLAACRAPTMLACNAGLQCMQDSNSRALMSGCAAFSRYRIDRTAILLPGPLWIVQEGPLKCLGELPRRVALSDHPAVAYLMAPTDIPSAGKTIRTPCFHRLDIGERTVVLPFAIRVCELRQTQGTDSSSRSARQSQRVHPDCGQLQDIAPVGSLCPGSGRSRQDMSPGGDVRSKDRM